MSWPNESMFRHFTIFEETYKVVHSHEIKAAVFIPKGLEPGQHPIVFNFHGGGLVYGNNLFASFISPWALKLTLECSAIFVSVDYRLLPSENGVADTLEDLEDFWLWSHSHLAQILQPKVPECMPDFNRLLLTGNSAGGYCAMQLALSHPDDISAVAVTYPMLDFSDDVLVKGPSAEAPTPLHLPREEMPSKNEVLTWITKSKKVVKSKAELEQLPLTMAAIQYGIYKSLIFDSSSLKQPEFDPIERIQAGARLPKKIWIMHGDEDSVIYIRASHKFVNLVREKLPDTTVRFDVAPGEDHAFELQKADWELHAIGALDFVKKSWLGH